MKNTFLSFVIFIILIFCMLMSLNSLNTICLRLQQVNDNLEEYVLKEDWDTAERTSKEYFKDWEKNSEKISIFIHHQEIDNIDNELWKLTQYIKCKNKDESLASIHVLKFLFHHVIDLEKVNLRNIL